MGNFVVSNQTPDKLLIVGQSSRLMLAPLQRIRVSGDPGELLGAAALAARSDHALDWEREPVRSNRLLMTACLAGFGISSLAAGLLGFAAARRTPVLVAGIVVSLGCAAAGLAVIARGRTSGTADTQEPHLLEPSKSHGDSWDLVRDFVIATLQGLSFVILVACAVAAPASAIYYGTELSDVIVLDSWHHAQLVQGLGNQDIVVARLLQLVLLIIVSIVPALMYFQFDREKLSTLVDRWLHAIFRLDPSVHTVAEVDAKYGRRVEEFYGTSLTTDAPRKRFRDLSPVLIATVLFAVGWIVVLLNSDANKTSLPTVQDLFRPDPTPMTMAFLGAYFLAVQVVLRGYIRGDLKPKTYNIITVRVIIAVILAWAMQALWGDNELVLAASFLAGVTPNTVLRRLRDHAGLLDRDGDDELKARSPLTVLDEIDIYERTRLEEEGITSVQALARHDFIDLILSSRIPIPRLVDWLDQALLYQHASEAMPALRSAGVRTATDFLRVLEDPRANSELAKVIKEDQTRIRPHLLRAVLQRDEWLAYVKNWRNNDGTESICERKYDLLGSVEIAYRRPQHHPPVDDAAIPAARDGSAPVSAVTVP